MSDAIETPELAQVPAERIAALAAELRELLGDAAVSDADSALTRATRDGSYLSPVIKEKLPLGRAQLVAYPTSAEQIAETVAAAVRHGVPITPRGKGTSNYGQAIPMAGGLVLDTSKARTIHEIGEGYVIADPGVTMMALETAANEAGQQLPMYPSTANSSLGGFVSGGSGGTGSIKNGMLHTGFVLEMDVAVASPEPSLVHLVGAETEPYIHKYGVVGVFAKLVIKLEPLQDWRAFYASFDDFHDVLALIRPFSALEPTPRLVSGDLPVLADALPDDPALPKGKASLRAILDVASLAEATRLVEEHGGTVQDAREGTQASVRLSMQSYNHPIQYLQVAYPDTYFHVEVSGDAIIDRIDELHEVYEDGMLHIEGQKGRPIGMLAGRYRGAEDVSAGFAKLEALGVGYHNPHQWYVDYDPAATIELAAETDPEGLFNPGKLVSPEVAAAAGTGSQVADLPGGRP